MTTKIKIKHCKHLIDISVYNNNFYELPVLINNCRIIKASYDDGESFLGYSLGDIENEKFSERYFLHTYDEDEIITFDSELIKTYNQWT